MTVIALYVYDVTTFTIDKSIEPMGGSPIDAGEVTLQPGSYRIPAGAQINAQTATRGESSFTAIALTKWDPPDPPLSPMAGYSMSEINAFFGSAGQENAI